MDSTPVEEKEAAAALQVEPSVPTQQDEHEQHDDGHPSPPTPASASGGEEWQVVDLPSPQESNAGADASSKPAGSTKAQKWKERLAKKSQRFEATTDTTATTTTTTEEEETGEAVGQEDHEKVVEESMATEDVDAAGGVGEEQAVEEGNQEHDEIIATMTDSSDIVQVLVTTTNAESIKHTTLDDGADTVASDNATNPEETPAIPEAPEESNQEDQQQPDTIHVDTEMPSTVEALPESDNAEAGSATNPVEEEQVGAESPENARNQPMSLQASYQEIAEAKRKREEAARLEAEQRAEEERLAKEAERLESIARLEEERKQLRLEEQRKARLELQQQQEQLQQQQQQQQQATVTNNAVEPVPTNVPPQPTPTATSSSSSTTSSSISMVVLVSKSFGTVAQRTNQDRAITTLQAKGIPCQEVDGSDPACKDRRNQLFDISGLRGQYPQFFVQEGETITFLGDFETFETLNETGQLVATATSTTTAPCSDEAPSKSRGIDEPAAPSTTMSTKNNNKLLIVLVSKSFGTLAQKTNQERAITMLKGNKIPYDEVDGSNPAFHELRNSLFAISGVRGNYPQFFSKEGDQIKFLGDFEAFEALNDLGTLASSFATETVEPEYPPAATKSVESNLALSKKLIALVSKSFATVALTTNQERAFTMLRNKNIPFEEVDGSDPQNKDQRNQLFEISGIRGKYPQFFIQDHQGTNITFLGDLEVLESMNDNGTLSISLLRSKSTEGAAESAPPMRDRNRSVSFTSAPNEIWENEFDPNTPPLPQPYSRATSKDSNVVPDESFENEFNDDDDEDEDNNDDGISRSTSRTASVDSLRVPSESSDYELEEAEASTMTRRKVSRANSEDSDMIPNESFENEFDSPVPTTSKKRLGRKSPDEIFENEFDPIDEEGTKDDNNDDDDDKDSPSLLLSMYLPIAIGVLGVAVIVGMWLSGQRGGPHSPHVQ